MTLGWIKLLLTRTEVCVVELAVGAKMWLPCQVKPGPFSNERMVFVDDDVGQWFGFVDVRWLKSGEDEGSDQVLARIVDVDGTQFKASIPGYAPRRRLFRGRVECVAEAS